MSQTTLQPVKTSNSNRTFLLMFMLLFLTVNFRLHAQGTNEATGEMKQYFFVLLSKGPHRDQDSAAVQMIQKGHLENIKRLYDEGKIDLAGPFLDNSDWRGIFVFNVATEKEVIDLLQTDPAIQSGRLHYTIRPWYAQRGSVLR